MRLVDDREALDFDGFAVGFPALLPRPAPPVYRNPPTGRKVMRESIGDDYHRAGALRHHIFPGVANDGDPTSARRHALSLLASPDNFLEHDVTISPESMPIS